MTLVRPQGSGYTGIGAVEGRGIVVSAGPCVQLFGDGYGSSRRGADEWRFGVHRLRQRKSDGNVSLLVQDSMHSKVILEVHCKDRVESIRACFVEPKQQEIIAIYDDLF